MATPNSYTDSGIGTIPEPINLTGIKVDTDTNYTKRLIVSGGTVKNKLIYEGDSIFSVNELRKITGFYENGDILLDSAFTVDLVNADLNRVRKNQFQEVAVLNDHNNIIGTLDGESLLPKKGLEYRNKSGLDPMVFNANTGLFKISTLTTI